MRRAKQFQKFKLAELNLVPLVDTLVSIVFFALVTATVGELAPVVVGRQPAGGAGRHERAAAADAGRGAAGDAGGRAGHEHRGRGAGRVQRPERAAAHSGAVHGAHGQRPTRFGSITLAARRTSPWMRRSRSRVTGACGTICCRGSCRPRAWRAFKQHLATSATGDGCRRLSAARRRVESSPVAAARRSDLHAQPPVRAGRRGGSRIARLLGRVRWTGSGVARARALRADDGRDPPACRQRSVRSL